MTEKDSSDEQEIAAGHPNGGFPAAFGPRTLGGPDGQRESAPRPGQAHATPLQQHETTPEFEALPSEVGTGAGPVLGTRPPVTLIETPQVERNAAEEPAPHPSLSIPEPHRPSDPTLPDPVPSQEPRPAREGHLPVETTAPPPSMPPPIELRAGQAALADPPEGEAPETAVASTSRWAYARKAGRFALNAAVAYLALILVLIPLYRVVNPPASTLMLAQWLTLNSVDRTWVPLEQISPNLVRAVIVSEDDRFCTHNGIDLEAMAQAIEHGGRGASTISMQVTKNLFLWNSRSYIRKLIEIPLTLLTELVWPKWRILELYLNVAEWGPGVFGAEAAAQHHFNKPAARLSASEAALLAASLPNPMVRDAGDPGPRTAAKGRVVQARTRAYGNVAACVTDRYAPAAPDAKARDNLFRPARRPQAPASQHRREPPSDSFFETKPPL